MKFFELLDELKDELENSPKAVFSGKKSIDAEIISEILEDLKKAIPNEIKQAKQITGEKEKILSTAKAKAEASVAAAKAEAKSSVDTAKAEAKSIIASAEDELATRVSDSQVVQDAQIKAKELMEMAQANAKEITIGAKEYADAILEELEMYFGDYLKVIRKNRLQLPNKRKS